MDTAYRVSPLRPGDPGRLGEYQLVGRLGAGGMGVVFLAESPDGSYVAIKLIHADLACDPEFTNRFRSEVERARQVPSFCTAEFLDADLDHDPPYLVVEYVDGPSLDEVVEERGPLRGGALHSLAVGVATALTGIHGAGVIHRDLKPDNVLLPPGSPKVIDFGIARPFVATSRHTQTDVMVGTVPYMAPERFSDEPGASVTAAADVFAWGCVIAYAGTGRTPFLGDSPSATVGRILTQPPCLDGLPESLRGPVLLALSKEPADRPTAAELLAMLVGEKPVPRPASVNRPVTAPPSRRDRAARPHRGGRALPVTLAVLLVLAGVTIFTQVLSDRTTGVTAGDAASAPATATSAPATATSAPSPARTSGEPPGPGATSSSSTNRSTVRASANPSRRNLALGRPATASSVEAGEWSASHAVDGDPLSRWSSGFSDPQWLIVDLGGQWQITDIVLRWEHAYAVSYRVEISPDGRAWKTVFRTTAGQGGDVTITTDVAGRYVRMYATRRSSGYGCSLYELEVR